MSISAQLSKVELKSPKVDFSRLAASPTLPWLPTSVDSSDLLETLKKQAPVDRKEIVEWMHYCAADEAVFSGFSEEYKVCSTVGGTVRSKSGDSFIPGVRVEDLIAESVQGRVVRERGYGIVYTPRGSFKVPVAGKTLFAMKDILAWATLLWAGTVQWCITLLRWIELANAPIKEKVRFPSSWGRVAPNFFTVSTRIPSLVCIMRIGLTSNKAQTVQIRGRGTKGSYHKVIFEDSFKVEKGENEVIYHVVGFPIVGKFTLELQPQDYTKTVLDYLEVYP